MHEARASTFFMRTLATLSFALLVVACQKEPLRSDDANHASSSEGEGAPSSGEGEGAPVGEG